MIAPPAIREYVYKNFPNFGINKNQQITRLLYEICKRENAHPAKIIKDKPSLGSINFPKLKKYLLARRFPESAAAGENILPYLPKIHIDAKYEVTLDKKVKEPEYIYAENDVSNSYVTKRFKKFFPRAKFIIIHSLKKYTEEKKFTLADYNSRQNNFFIIREKFDFLKKCPCTANAVYCGYHIFNLGTGCIYECSYCYLQEYVNSPGIIIPGNIEDFFDAFKKYSQNIRLGSGEFADSLALDPITNFSSLLVDFFKEHTETIFEFKTKSNNVKTLLLQKPSKNIVISWSLNPQYIVKTNEFYTASLNDRINAARACSDAGYSVAFHFDPIMHYSGWDKDYEILVSFLFDKIDTKSIRWLSIGTFRFTPRLKTIIENRFPKCSILDEELYIGFDGKMRYGEKTRLNIYKKMLSWIKKRSRQVPVYLCMENKNIVNECKIML